MHLGLGALPGAALAQPRDDAKVWLKKMAHAAATSSFQGTSIVTAAGSVSTTRTVRFVVGGQTFEHTESVDGPKRSVFRHNQLVHTLWPDRKLAIVELREDAAARLASSASTVGQPASQQTMQDGGLQRYDAVLESSDRVAAHTAQVMVLKPLDAYRFAQRLWADADTGLMLRAEVLDDKGQVLTSTAYTELRQGIKPQSDALLAAMHKLDGYRVVRAQLTPTTLEREGWRLNVPVAGFRLVSCVSRLREAGEGDAAGATIVQSIFSDGLVHVSIFLEPHDPTRHQPMMSTWGATHALAQRQGNQWVTVMGDVPAITVQRFAAALERLR
jgi:sigma-E factor negative regulatory protein RseB